MMGANLLSQRYTKNCPVNKELKPVLCRGNLIHIQLYVITWVVAWYYPHGAMLFFK